MQGDRLIGCAGLEESEAAEPAQALSGNRVRAANGPNRPGEMAQTGYSLNRFAGRAAIFYRATDLVVIDPVVGRSRVLKGVK